MPRRKHFKVNKELPKAIVEAVNKKIVEGYTYQDIENWLSKDIGHKIGKSSIQRYGKDFLARLERLKIAKDQAKAIVETSPDAPATELAEAANQMAMTLIMEILMDVQDKVEGEKLTEVFKAIAQLERSAVNREKLKMDFQTKMRKAVSKMEATVQTKGLDQETLKVIKEQIYGIIGD